MPRKEQFYRCDECALSGPCYACLTGGKKPQGCLRHDGRFPEWQPAYPPEPAETGAKLRLVLTHRCDRACPGCCNKQINWAKVPTFKGDYALYDEVLITGGEPLLVPDLLVKTIREIRKGNPRAKIILYTAKLDMPFVLADVMLLCDGATITLHEPADRGLFSDLAAEVHRHPADYPLYAKSLRVNVFEEVGPFMAAYYEEIGWSVKENIKWIENCPLPDGEVLMVHENCLKEAPK